MKQKPPINDLVIREHRKLIGQWLEELRKERGWSQQELADMMGVQRASISKIETGAFAMTIDYLAKFSYYLDCYIFLPEKEAKNDLCKTMRERWRRRNDDQ